MTSELNRTILRTSPKCMTYSLTRTCLVCKVFSAKTTVKLFVNRVDWRSRASLIMYRDAYRPSSSECTEPEKQPDKVTEGISKKVEPVVLRDTKPQASNEMELQDASPDTDAASSITMSDQDSPKGELPTEVAGDCDDVVVSDTKPECVDTKTESEEDTNKSVESREQVDDSKGMETKIDTSVTIHDPTTERVVIVKEEVKKIESKSIDETDSKDITAEDNEMISPVKEHKAVESSESTNEDKNIPEEKNITTETEPESTDANEHILKAISPSVSKSVASEAEHDDAQCEIIHVQTDSVAKEEKPKDVQSELENEAKLVISNESLTAKDNKEAEIVVTGNIQGENIDKGDDNTENELNKDEDNEIVTKSDENIVSDSQYEAESSDKPKDSSISISNIQDSASADEANKQEESSGLSEAVPKTEEQEVTETFSKSTESVSESLPVSEDKKDEIETDKSSETNVTAVQSTAPIVSTIESITLTTTETPTGSEKVDSQTEQPTKPTEQVSNDKSATDSTAESKADATESKSIDDKAKAPTDIPLNDNNDQQTVAEIIEKTEDKLLETMVQSEIIEKSSDADSVVVETSPTKELPDKPIAEPESTEKSTEPSDKADESQGVPLGGPSEENRSSEEKALEEASQKSSVTDNVQPVEQNQESLQERIVGEQPESKQQSPLGLPEEKSQFEKEASKEETQKQSDTKDVQPVEQAVSGGIDTKVVSSETETASSVEEQVVESKESISKDESIHSDIKSIDPKEVSGEKLEPEISQQTKSKPDATESNDKLDTTTEDSKDVAHIQTESKTDDKEDVKKSDDTPVESQTKDTSESKSESKTDSEQIKTETKSSNLVNGEANSTTIDEKPEPEVKQTDSADNPELVDGDANTQSDKEPKKMDGPRVNGVAEESDENVMKPTTDQKIETALLNGDGRSQYCTVSSRCCTYSIVPLR